MDGPGSSRIAALDERDDPRVMWPLLALFWLGSVAATMTQVYASTRLNGLEPTFLDLVRWIVPGYVVWLVSVPLIVFVLAPRFRFENGQWLRSVPVHLLACLCIAMAVMTVDTAVLLWQGSAKPFVQIMSNLARGWLLWLFFTYWFFLAFLLAIRHYTTGAARRLRATRLEAALATAQLAALRTQIHPHFLFNALNSISSLIDEDRRVARRMIAQVADLLRASLADGAGEWTLRRELELLERYTEIEKMRFGQRLRVEVCCEPAALDVLVPSLLLQPLVENAILHGIEPSLHGGRVRVSARQVDGTLALEVSDDGVGMARSSRERTGLSNTRKRLDRCYPGRQTFSIAYGDPTGTRVLIGMPWITTPSLESQGVAAY